MQLGPRLDQTLFAAIQCAFQHLDDIHCNHNGRAAAPSMKMWPVVATTRLCEHTNDDSKET